MLALVEGGGGSEKHSALARASERVKVRVSKGGKRREEEMERVYGSWRDKR